MQAPPDQEGKTVYAPITAQGQVNQIPLLLDPLGLLGRLGLKEIREIKGRKDQLGLKVHRAHRDLLVSFSAALLPKCISPRQPLTRTFFCYLQLSGFSGVSIIGPTGKLFLLNWIGSVNL